MSDSYRAPSGGPTHGIVDPIAASEIRKLWDAIGARATGPDSAKYVTVEDLNAAKREVLGKIPAIDLKAYRQDIGGSRTVVEGGGGSSPDILRSNNTWTGTNWYTRKTAKNVPTMRLQSYNSGTIAPPPGSPTIMLDTGYQAVLDIRKTTSAAADAVLGGGTAGIYVQHRVDGTTATIQNVNSGIRVQTETWQASTHPVNDVVSGYFGLLNHGFNSNGFGVHVDAYHTATGVCVTYGVSVESYRNFLDGKVIAFHARAISSPSYNVSSDWAFLASPDSSSAPAGFKTAFGAGSDYIGTLNCDYGLDLAYASCYRGAVRIKSGNTIQLNGPADNVGLFFEATGRVQFFSDVGRTVAIGNDGSLLLHAEAPIEFNDGGPDSHTLKYGSGRLAISYNGAERFVFFADGTLGLMNPSTTGAAGPLMGYVYVNLGGFTRLIPFHKAD